LRLNPLTSFSFSLGIGLSVDALEIDSFNKSKSLKLIT